MSSFLGAGFSQDLPPRPGFQNKCRRMSEGVPCQPAGEGLAPRGVVTSKGQIYQTGSRALFRCLHPLFLWYFYPLDSSQFVIPPSVCDERHRPRFTGAALALSQTSISSQLTARTPTYSQEVISLCCMVLLIRVYLAG